MNAAQKSAIKCAMADLVHLHPTVQEVNLQNYDWKNYTRTVCEMYDAFPDILKNYTPIIQHLKITQLLTGK